ncbi:hypothetical protein IDM40_27535 [Nocardiopsis sp. HNM0947]|uniref:Uncharacterized protein n=1 Tax=Nocardiopsis coralli TaxID=2772213 RepID=A0ABR9PF91_9ACTN|nr:hypothetical protein [Nocardiopsis coralli]MBE3002420.1 hypothetical protein [Nocardiopsis coralli]
MAEVRISIGFDPHEAERVRSHADRAGMDVSSYVVNAVIRQMADTESTEAQFAGVDALIADAEMRADQYGPPDAADALSAEERREADEAMGLIDGTRGAEGRNRRGGA